MLKKLIIVFFLVFIPLSTFAYTSPQDILNSIRLQLEEISRKVNARAQLGAAAGSTSRLATLSASLEPGQWTILNNDGDSSNYNWDLLVACKDANNSGDCGDTIINYADKGLWDPNTKEIHFLGAGHLRAWKFITYTASTDKWIRQPKPYFDCRETESLCWPMGHGYEHSTINPETGDIYWRGFSSSEMYRWTKSTQTWAPLESSSNPNPTIVGALAYFPEMGGLLFIGGGKVHFFNETTNTWSQLAANLPMAEYHNVATYDPINKIVIFGGGNDSPKLHKINASGVITAIADAPAAVGVNSSVFTVDPASGKFLLFTSAGTFHEYNVTTNTWSNLNSSSVPIWNTGAANKSEFRVAIPISTYGVVAIMGYNPRTVWLYKHSSSGAVPVTTPTTPVTTPTPTNGSCGTSANQSLTTVPVANLCSAGTPSSVANTSSYRWTCIGVNGGTTASCSATKQTEVPAPVVSVPAPAAPAPASGSGITTLKLLSATSGTKPFTVGHSFKEGDVPSGYYITSSEVTLQSDIKNRWPDGSVKFAVLSGQVSLTANSENTITLARTNSTPGGSDLNTTNLKATGISASVSYGNYGTVSWSNTAWDSPFKTLIQGPQMSSWTYRKAIGSDAHLVAWLEVRLYKNGSVEVIPWLENGYLKVAAPGERSGTASFSLGGTERYSGSLSLLNHQRAYLGSGTKMSHWLGEDPQVVPKHNVAYLMSTKLVPNYKGVTSSNSNLFGRLASSYTPLAQASFPAGMGTAGYHSSIGILPEWDAAFFTTNADPRAYLGVLINGYAAGRYGIHFRDETTNLPIRFSSYPNLVIGSGSSIGSSGASSVGQQTPAATGTTPPTYNSSHSPSMGYLAYLLTGHQYFLEELQFLATANFLKNTDTGRAYTNGVFLTTAGANTTRGAAWSIRTLAQAAAVTPDNDSLRTEFVNSLNENIKYYEGRYVAQPTNPLGLVEPYSNYNGVNVDPHASAIWMDDFFTMSFGYLKDLKAYSTSLQKKVDDFTAWKYKSVIGRLGGSGTNQYSYRYVGQYTVNYAPKNNPDYNTGAGPWYSSWGEVARSMGKGTTGEIGESIVDGYPEEATGYISNMLPALSYAVEHGAAGAGDAWTRFSSASNYNSHIALYNNDPVWGVYPRTFTSTPIPPVIVSTPATPVTPERPIVTTPVSGGSSNSSPVDVGSVTTPVSSGGGGGGGKSNSIRDKAVTSPTTGNSSGSNNATKYTRNLKLGDRGEDVKKLQQFLNRNGFTIATKGEGSLGNETTYFGPGTKRALQAFQDSYRSELVTPFGEKVGTGYFGPATRAKVEKIEVPITLNTTTYSQESKLALIKSLLAQVQLLQAQLQKMGR